MHKGLLQAAEQPSWRDPFTRPLVGPSAIPPLRRYPPERWQMVGRVTSQRVAEAWLEAPDGAIHRVRVGTEIGPGRARVSALDRNGLHIQASDEAGADIILPLRRAEQE